MGERKRLKEIPKNCKVKYWNERIPNILQKQDHWTLWEIDSLMYAAITKILNKDRAKCIQKNDQRIKKKNNFVEKTDMRKTEIANLRKIISWIVDIIKTRHERKKLTYKQYCNLKKMKTKYKVSSTKKLTEIAEKLKQMVKVLATRCRRAEKSALFKSENSEFRKSQGAWLEKKIHDNSDQNKGSPTAEEVTRFWKSIWGNDTSNKEVSEKWLNWEQQFKENVNIVKRPVDNPHIPMGLMKKVIKRMKPLKAPGWDQIIPYYWQKLNNIHKVLNYVINRSFENSTCEKWETLGRTILFPKKGKDSTKPESYRPITCLMIIYKIKSAIIARKLNTHIHDNNLWPFEQFGALGGTQGSKEVLLLDAMIAEEVRLYKRNIFMVWTDVKKAYDSIQQRYIIRILVLLEVPEWIINFIKQAMKSWRTKLQMIIKDGMVVTDVIKIVFGKFQGDSLSPLLFCLSYLMVSVILRKKRLGYIPGPPGKRNVHHMKSHFIFMDDFKGLTSTESSLKAIIDISTEILEEIGLEIGLDKCAVLKVNKGKIIQMDGIDLSVGGIIQSVDINSSYSYLGIMELLDPCHSDVKEEIISKMTKVANIVWGSELDEKNKVDAHNMLVVSKLTYSFGIINWTQSELDDINRKLRKCISKYNCLNIHSNTNRLYLARKNGGRGLINIHHLFNRAIVSLVGYIFNANSEHAKLIKEYWVCKKKGTLLKKAEDIIENLKLNISFTANGMKKDGNVIHHKMVGSIMKKEYQKEYATWIQNNLHGKIIKRCIDDKMLTYESFKWLKHAKLRGPAVSTLFAIQEQVIPTRVIKKRIWKNINVVSEKCRMCNDQLETVSHVISGCSILANNLYKIRHDNVVRVVYYYLLHKLGFAETWQPWYDMSNVEPVKENDQCTIYWDYPLQTNNAIMCNKPDIVVIYKKCDAILIIEGSVPWDENLAAKVMEKRNKYIPLGIELKNLYAKSSYTVCEIVIGSTGLVNDSLRSAISKLCDDSNDINKIINFCQKAAILGTVRICRQLFDSII